MPEAGERVWKWYWELSAARGHSGSGALPIGFGEIKAWAELTGTCPSPWEVQAIRSLDREYLAFSAEQEKKLRR